MERFFFIQVMALEMVRSCKMTISYRSQQWFQNLDLTFDFKSR